MSGSRRMVRAAVSFFFVFAGLFCVVRFGENNAAVRISEDERKVLAERVSLLEEALQEAEGVNAILLALVRGDQLPWEDQGDLLLGMAATPLIWPAAGWVSSEYGYRRSPFGRFRDHHSGLDIASQRGTPIQASADGFVTFAGYQGGLGRAVIIDHGFGVASLYGHASRIFVRDGMWVRRGTVIGLVGSTGASTGPHLHYEIQVDGVPLDPMEYLFIEEVNHEDPYL